MTSVVPAATRPWTAGTAAWLSAATAACALLGAVFGALGLDFADEDRAAHLVLLLLAPAAVLTLVGARALTRRRGRGVLLAGLAAIAAVLAAAGVLDTEMQTAGVGLTSWLFLCLGPPVASAAFAVVPSVGSWLSGRSVPVPPRPDAATTAAVLGIVTGIPAVLLGWLGTSLELGGWSAGSWFSLAVLLAGVALLVGARRLLDGHPPGVLAGAAVVAAGVVIVGLLEVLAGSGPG